MTVSSEYQHTQSWRDRDWLNDPDEVGGDPCGDLEPGDENLLLARTEDGT